MKKLERMMIRERRLGVVAMLAVALASLSGCRICADCEDLAYPAYGGAWQRTCRDSGRVGSIFDPGGAKLSELVPRDAPLGPDELERLRQEGDDKAYDPDRGREEKEDEPQTDDEQDLESKADELRGRELDDIEEEKEDELRKRGLDDIKIRLIPGQPMPPVLR